MNRKHKKRFVIFGSILLGLVVFLALLSPIAKWLIQKYDVPITGREITVGWVYVNPFTGFVYLHNLAIYEEKSDSIFIEAKGLSANIAMYKMLIGTYDITSVTLNTPTGFAIQKELVFNFFDLIEKFKADESAKPSEEQVKFSLRNITIKNGTFYARSDRK